MVARRIAHGTGDRSAVNPVIERLIEEMEQNVARAETVARGLSDPAFNWRPEPQQWSVAQCLSHLCLINEVDLPHLDRSIAEARSKGWRHPGPYNFGFLTRRFISLIEPPVRRRFPAPKSYTPPPTDVSREATLRRYCEVIEAMITRLKAADGLDLRKARTVLPALPLLKMPLGGRFALMASHDRRHLWQAENVRGNSAFPH